MHEGCFYVISEGKADGKGPGGVVGWNGGFAGDEGCHGKKIPQETWERVGKEEGATRPAQTNDRDLFDTTIRFSDLERLKILGAYVRGAKRLTSPLSSLVASNNIVASLLARLSQESERSEGSGSCTTRNPSPRTRSK